MPTPVKARKLGKKSKSPKAKESPWAMLQDQRPPTLHLRHQQQQQQQQEAVAKQRLWLPSLSQPTSHSRRLENAGQMLLRQTRELLKTANKVLAKKPFLKGQRLGIRHTQHFCPHTLLGALGRGGVGLLTLWDQRVQSVPITTPNVSRKLLCSGMHVPPARPHRVGGHRLCDDEE